MLTPEQIADGWIAHDGGDQPLPADTVVDLIYRGPADANKGIRIPFACTGRLAWWHDGADDDIVAYRVGEAP